MVTRWYCAKVWSSEKSVEEVETEDEEDAGRVLPLCPPAVTAKIDSEIDRAIKVKARIKFPESDERLLRF